MTTNTIEIVKAMQSMDRGTKRQPIRVTEIDTDQEESLKFALSTNRPGEWASDHREESRNYTGYNYVAIEAIASQVSQAIAEAYVTKGNRDSRRKSVKADEEDEKVGDSHPVMRILGEPNPHQSGSLFRYEQAMQIRLTGTCLIWNVRNGFGKIVERYVIPTAIARPYRPNSKFPYGYWKISPEGARYDAPFLLGGLIYSIGFEIDARAMQVIRLPHPTRKDDGYSPIAANAIWSDLSTGIDVSRISTMRNGMKPSALVTLNNGDARMDDQEFDAVSKRINELYAGADKAGKIMIVEGANATVTKLSHAPNEMDYKESHNQARDDTLANHRVPAVAVGITSPTGREGLYAPLEQYTHLTIQPLLNILADDDNRFWVWQYGKGLYVTYTATSIQDEDREIKKTDQLVRGKAITKNELRILHGREPWDDERGDQLAGEKDIPKEPPADDAFRPDIGKATEIGGQDRLLPAGDPKELKESK